MSPSESPTPRAAPCAASSGKHEVGVTGGDGLAHPDRRTRRRSGALPTTLLMFADVRMPSVLEMSAAVAKIATIMRA